MERLNFDTTFLIDLQREANGTPACAHAFLHQHREAIPCISLTVLGEYAEGFPDPSDADCLRMIDSFEILPCTRAVAGQYSRISRQLRREGLRIGGNDLWIAAHSLAHQLPLVTRNLRDFTRIPDLQVRGYA